MLRFNLANRITFALIGFSILALAGLYISITSIRVAMNTQAERMAFHAVESRMSALHDKIRMMARDYNNWADLFLALQSGDIDFVADNYAITAIFGDMFNAVTMFDGKLGEPIAWLENGDRKPTSTFLSGAELSSVREHVRPLDTTERETFDFYMMLKGELHFLSASYLLPDTEVLLDSIKQEELSIAVLARRIRKEEVSGMEHALMIDDVSVTQHVDPERVKQGTAVLPLYGLNGSPVAYLSWMPHRSGDALVGALRPVLVGIVMVFLTIAALATIAVHRNARDLLRREEEASALARIDSLTGLANRLAFNEHVASVLPAQPRTLAIIVIDLNGFKRINDMVGHQGGDQLIRKVAKSLAGLEGEHVLVARLGGDEFGIVMTEAADILAQIHALADQVTEKLQSPFAHHGYSFDISAAQGASINDDSQTVAEELLRRADYAMYHAKQQKSKRIRIYSEAIEQISQLDRRIEIALRAALERPTEFSIAYQPIVCARTGQFIRAEALARWEPPFLGSIAPDSFIRVAEESALIVPLGWLLLDAVCNEVRYWPGMRVSVNVSPIQLMDDGFVDGLIRVLSHYEIDSRRIEIEVTESVMILNVSVVAQRLSALRELGITLALDDFGSGFSSFGSLRALPFDTLKIDRTLVSCAAETARNSALVQSVVMLGQSLGKAIVGEGVETESDSMYLTQAGCDLLQGYLYGMPMPIKDLVDRFLLRERISA
jgi:diguanylate cyclase (GGDEF)-like protein